MCVWETTCDIFISKQFVCEVKCTEHCSCILIFALFWKILAQMLQSYIIFCVCGSVIFAGEVASDLLMIHRVNIILQISLSWMKHDSTPKIVAWKYKCCVTSRRIPSGSARYNYSLKQICMDQARLLATKTARDKIINCFCEEWYRLNIHRPFPHYAPVSKDKEVKTRLGWAISYKSPHFVQPSLELMPLFTGIRERSIGQALKRQETCI